MPTAFGPNRHASRSKGRPDTGQASVEFALVLPLLILLALGLLQAVVLGMDAARVNGAAREAARAAAVGANPQSDGSEAGLQATTLAPSRMKVTVSEAGGRVRVDVAYTSPTDVPLVGGLLGDVTLTATAVMRVEGAR